MKKKTTRKVLLLLLGLGGLAMARPGGGEEGVSSSSKILMEKNGVKSKKPIFSTKYPKKPEQWAKSSVAKATQSPLETYFFDEQEKLASVESKNEKAKICMSVKEDSAENFLTKLGLITQMIDDVTQFRIRMKRSRSRLNADDLEEEQPSQNDAKTSEAVGMNVGAVEAMLKMKKKPHAKSKKPVRFYKSKSNSLESKRWNKGKNGAKQSKDHLSSCFGYEYMSAIDALDSNGFPDVEIFQEYFSGLSDDELALQLSDTVTSCADPMKSSGSSSKCPDARRTPGWLSKFSVESMEIPSTCSENCFTNSDCAEDEVCCANECGGHVCYRAKSGSEPQSRSLCQDADAILKCVYDTIRLEICPGLNIE